MDENPQEHYLESLKNPDSLESADKRQKDPAFRFPRKIGSNDMDSDDDSDDEEEYTSLKPIPPSAFYDRYEKIRKANLELSRTGSSDSRSHAPKVRFNDDVTFDVAEEDPTQGDTSSPPASPEQDVKSTPSKVLLVTVPTGFSQESEEVVSESEESEEQEAANPEADSFRGDEREGAAERGAREQVDPEEEVEGRREESPEAGLTEWFSRSISLEEAVRPSSGISVEVRRREERPATAPARRACCRAAPAPRLPAYNGLRSEYGLSADQLSLRERRKNEIANALKMEKEQKYLEHKKKRKENEKTFNNWLIKKKREAEAKAIKRLRQSNYCFRTIPAPTAHLDKIGILRRKMLRKENTCFLLNEIFKTAKPHEQKTYRIYLGLRPQ